MLPFSNEKASVGELHGLGAHQSVHMTCCTARAGQTVQAPLCAAQHPLGCTFGLGTMLNQALCLFDKTPLRPHRRAGEGLRSAPAAVPSSSRTGGSLLSALMQSGCWVPTGSPHGAVGVGGRRDCVLCCSLCQTAPAIPLHGREKDFGLYS